MSKTKKSVREKRNTSTDRAGVLEYLGRYNWLLVSAEQPILTHRFILQNNLRTRLLYICRNAKNGSQDWSDFFKFYVRRTYAFKQISFNQERRETIKKRQET
jgi:hypothetical protein